MNSLLFKSVPPLASPLSLSVTVMDSALELILAQTKQNIQFLISQGALEKKEGDDILTKLELSAATSKTTRHLASQSLSSPDTGHLFTASKAQTPEQEPPSYSATAPESPKPHAPVPSQRVALFAVKALWAYNEDGGVRATRRLHATLYSTIHRMREISPS